MAARVFSAFKRISRTQSSQHVLWTRTYCSSRSIEPPTSGRDECTFRSSEAKKLPDAYKAGFIYLVKESMKLDCEMERIKRSIAEDLSRMGYLEEHEVPDLKTVFAKLNLPHQAALLSRLDRRMWDIEQVRGELQRMETRFTDFLFVAAKFRRTMENDPIKRTEAAIKRMERAGYKVLFFRGRIFVAGFVFLCLGYFL